MEKCPTSSGRLADGEQGYKIPLELTDDIAEKESGEKLSYYQEMLIHAALHHDVAVIRDIIKDFLYYKNKGIHSLDLTDGNDVKRARTHLKDYEMTMAFAHAIPDENLDSSLVAKHGKNLAHSQIYFGNGPDGIYKVLQNYAEYFKEKRARCEAFLSGRDDESDADLAFKTNEYLEAVSGFYLPGVQYEVPQRGQWNKIYTYTKEDYIKDAAQGIYDKLAEIVASEGELPTHSHVEERRPSYLMNEIEENIRNIEQRDPDHSIRNRIAGEIVSNEPDPYSSINLSEEPGPEIRTICDELKINVGLIGENRGATAGS